MFRSVKVRLASVILGLAGVVMLYAYVYMYGMANFEGQEIPYYVALQVATESITTAGFGGHAPWDTLSMNIIVIIMNVTGVLLFFIGVPVALAPFVGPIVKDAVRDEAPTETDMKGHTVLVGFEDSNQLLRKKLGQSDIKSLFVMDDRETADRIHRDGSNVLFVNEYNKKFLSNANIEHADTVIIGMEGGTDPSVVLSVKDIDEDVNVVSVSYTESNEKYVRKAGADRVIKPKSELGQSLATRATKDISARINDEISDLDIKTSYVTVDSDDDVCGKTVEDAEEQIIGRIIAGWFFGTLVVNPDPDTVVEENSVLLITDGSNQEREQELDTVDQGDTQGNGPIMICGYGDVGKAVDKFARREGYETITVDKSEEEADLMDDITNEDFMRDEVDLDDCMSVVVAVSDDDTAVYTNLVVNNVSPTTDVVTRSNKVENIWKIYNSGSNFVLSLETLTADAILDYVSKSSDIISSNDEVIVSSVSGQEYQGKKLQDTDIGNSSVTVFAVLRKDGMITDVHGEIDIKEEDEIMYIESE